jgi:hypothetical protein
MDSAHRLPRGAAAKLTDIANFGEYPFHALW